MGGTVHGLVNRRFTRGPGDTSDYGNIRNVFPCYAAFFDHLSTPAGGNIMTRVGQDYGNGTGFDPVGGASPIASTYAWGLWKMNTSTLRPGGGSAMGEVYIFVAMLASVLPASQGLLVQGSSSTTFQATVSMSIAFREDGGDPWNGTASTIGSPVWTDGGVSTVHVVTPRSNNPGGSHDTNKNNMSPLGERYYYFDLTYGYFHGIADEDNFVTVCTPKAGIYDFDDPLIYSMSVFGMGTLQPNCGSDPYFCYAWSDNAMPFGRGSTYGDTGGTAGNQGGVKLPRSTISTCYSSVYNPGLDNSRAPNPYSTTANIYDENGSTIYSPDAWLGWGHEPGGADFWRTIYKVPNESIDAVAQRAAFGTPTTLQDKTTLPWPTSIGEAPGATRTTNGGVLF